MKIVFDHKIFSSQKYGGISRYFARLATQLANVQDVEAKIIAPIYINEYARYLPPGLVQGWHVPLSPKIGTRICWAANGMMMPLLMKQFKPDIVHSTYYLPHVAAPKNAKRVVTVYDMIHERFSSMFPIRDKTAAWKEKAVRDANHVICISENTRRDLVGLYDLNPNKVSVVYLACDGLNSGADSLDGSMIFEKLPPYLLYVGDRGGYKNFKTFLRAYAGSVWLQGNFRIVCFGGGRFRADELALIRELGIKPQQIEQIDGSDKLLSMYYQHAVAFVYPSLYEGFGIPSLEAMALGCPVICSNTSSIPEIVGDAGEYFDPEHVESIRAAIESVLQSSDRRAELVLKGFKKCTQYSWRRCASETLGIYQGLVE